MAFQIFAALAALLVMFIPGMAAGFALLRGTAFSRFEKGIFGLILGLLLVPLLGFLEHLLLGFSLNAPLVLANALLVLLVSLGALSFQGATFRPTFSLEVSRDWKKIAVFGFLLLTILIGFYVRISPAFTTEFYEFDPYYYMKITRELVQQGSIPLFSSDVYFPKNEFHHWAPMVHYLTGSWYFLHQFFTGAAGYDQSVLILLSEIYPPLMGALLSFIVFILMKEEYNEYLALVPAALFALTPQLIKKFAGGVTEQQPFGVFTALLVLTLFLVALKRRSYRLAAFAGLAGLCSILGSQQYLWPVMIVGAFLGLQGVLDYLGGHFDRRKTIVAAILVGAFSLGVILMTLYQNHQYFDYTNPYLMLAVGGFGLSLVLQGLSRGISRKRITERLGVLVVFGVVLVAAMAVTHLDDIVLNTVVGQAKIAVTSSAVAKTVQEEGKTVPELYPGSFGVLNPNALLLLATLLALILLVAQLMAHKMRMAAAAVSVVGLFGVLFTKTFSSLLAAVGGFIPNAAVKSFVTLLTDSDVFVYMLITLASASLYYLISDKKSEGPLLVLFIFFPIAYIGLNKLKFILHLAVALVLVFGYLLGESLHLFEFLNRWLKLFSSAEQVRFAGLGVLLFLSAIVVVLQGQTVQASMDELSFTRLPPDWVASYQWLSQNTPQDSRVLSWWDYGHWTTFLGQRNSVLDPTNLYGDYDQEVARALVNGNDEDLYRTMEFHNASHILVDGDLVGKWGALVFLSGTCSHNNSDICPVTPEVDFNPGPGKSRYELQHYYEDLSVGGECPSNLSPVPLILVQSNFGTAYCAGQNEYFLVTQAGLNSTLKRPFKILGRDNVTFLDDDTSYWIGTGQGLFVNINPYLEPFGYKSNVLHSAFTRLYFLENFPGFTKVYNSPNGQVKIFEYRGRPKPA